jgi:hypothetical protein
LSPGGALLRRERWSTALRAVHASGCASAGLCVPGPLRSPLTGQLSQCALNVGAGLDHGRSTHSHCLVELLSSHASHGSSQRVQPRRSEIVHLGGVSPRPKKQHNLGRETGQNGPLPEPPQTAARRPGHPGAALGGCARPRPEQRRPWRRPPAEPARPAPVRGAIAIAPSATLPATSATARKKHNTSATARQRQSSLV